MPDRGGDQAILPLGIHRIPVPIPFPQAGGPVNVVAVEEEGGGIALFDTGLGSEEAQQALLEGLSRLDFGLEDVRRIFITHGHLDHFGLAETIRKASGAPVFVHPDDRSKIAGPSHWEEVAPAYTAFFRKIGADQRAVDNMVAVAGAHALMADRLPMDIGHLVGGERLTFRRCVVEIHEGPGHTTGLVYGVASPREGDGPRILLANDMLMEKVSPNPVFELRDGVRFRALPTYFRSLAQVRGLEVDWVLPGHGPLFQEHRRVIDELLVFYERRREKLLGMIPEKGATPMELMSGMFPGARELELFLVIGEVFGLLDVLEDEGRVSWTEQGERVIYERSG